MPDWAEKPQYWDMPCQKKGEFAALSGMAQAHNYLQTGGSSATGPQTPVIMGIGSLYGGEVVAPFWSA